MKRSLCLTAVFLASLTACKQNEVAADNNVATAAATTANMAAENMASNAASTGAIDTAFVTDGIKGDTAEVAIGQLAASKGASKGVKDFGQMLATDHGAHKQKLIDLANTAGVPVPQEPADAGKANLDKLQGLSGDAFDSEFARMMVDSHQKGIAKNEAQAKTGDPQTAALAEQTLPTLRKHLQIAEGLQK